MLIEAHDPAWPSRAECLHDSAAIAAALDVLAARIVADLAGRQPLVLTVMGGALIFAGHLLPRLTFPLECDYVHASRYRGALTGGEILWKVRPPGSVKGRVVLVLDDILDEGYTLAAIKRALLDGGADQVYMAVMVEKHLGRSKPVAADYVGLTVPDRYVFGFGMDVEGLWRNLPAIYALPE